MPWPFGTMSENQAKEQLRAFLYNTIKTDPWKGVLGDKPIEVIMLGENRPPSPCIEITKMGSPRFPWVMVDNAGKHYAEELWTFMLDIRVEEIQGEKKPERYQSKAGGIPPLVPINERLCEMVKWCFWLPSYRRKLNLEHGLFDAKLFDEREMYRGTDYDSPYRLEIGTKTYLE